MQYTVACGCGAKMTLDARAFGHPRVCRSCGGSVTVGWKKVPGSQRTVPFAVTRARVRAGGVRADQTPYVALCGCGYRRPVPESALGTTPRCPGCGKLMTVEKLGYLNDPGKFSQFTAPAPRDTTPMHLRPPLRTRLVPGTTAFDCPCGERLLVRSGSAGRAIQCPACDRRLVLEFQKEPPPEPASEEPKAPKPGRPVRQPGPGESVCPCGNIIPPRTSRSGMTFACSACGRKGHVQMSTDPQTGAPSFRAIVTEGPTMPARHSFSEGGEPSPPPPVAAPGAPGPEEAVFEPAPETEEDAFAEAIADDAQPVICECGSEIFILPSAAGQNVQCPRCELLLSVELHAGELRVRTIGRMDQDTWTLEDFQ